MNNARRKEIDTQIEKLREIQASISSLKDSAETLVADVQQIMDDEQEYLDNMPECLQDSAKGEAAQAAIEELGNIPNDLINGFEALEEVIDANITNLENAKGN